MEIQVTIPDTLTEHLQPEEPTAKHQLQQLLLEEAVTAYIASAKSRRCRRWPGWSWRIVRTLYLSPCPSHPDDDPGGLTA